MKVSRNAVTNGIPVSQHGGNSDHAQLLLSVCVCARVCVCVWSMQLLTWSQTPSVKFLRGLAKDISSL